MVEKAEGILCIYEYIFREKSSAIEHEEDEVDKGGKHQAAKYSLTATRFTSQDTCNQPSLSHIRVRRHSNTQSTGICPRKRDHLYLRAQKLDTKSEFRLCISIYLL